MVTVGITPRMRSEKEKRERERKKREGKMVMCSGEEERRDGRRVNEK